MISITTLIIVVTVVISLTALNNPSLMEKLIMNPYLVTTEKQIYRTVTSGFVHAGWAHLGFNMFAFFFFGRVVEQYFNMILGASGWLLYLVFYLTAIIASDFSTLFKHRHNPSYNSLGASGGVSAVVFMSILYAPLNEIYIYFIKLPGFIFGILYVLYSYWQSKSSSDGINHDAHLYGAIYGVIFGIIMYPPSAMGSIDQIFQFRLF